VRLCDKFGLHVEEAKHLLRLASKLEVNITGLCFHIGSGASNPEAYNKAIRLSREIYNYNDILERMHCITMIDIGGVLQTLTSTRLRLLFEQQLSGTLALNLA
jgi:ornithine decarboxylase